MGPARRAVARFALYVAGYALLYAAFLKHEALYQPGVGSFLVGAVAVIGLFLIHEGFHVGRHQNRE